MISVVIPLFNKEVPIGRTLESVLAQSYRDFEVVVVDDGSRDGSAAVVESFDDPRIRLIRHENAGVSAARNRGIAEARGEFVALLDADDIWRENYLQTQFELTQKYPQCDIFATDYCFCNSKGVEKATIIRKLPFDGEDGFLTNYFEVASCSHPPLCSSTVMVRKGAIESVGGFPVGIKSGEDLITWARLAVNYKIAYSRRVSATFIVDSLLKNDDQRQRFPEKQDFVGEELKNLRQYKPKGLNAYISLWHKMRCRILLCKHCRGFAIKEALISLRYKPSIKTFIFLTMALLPNRLSDYIFKKYVS